MSELSFRELPMRETTVESEQVRDHNLENEVGDKAAIYRKMSVVQTSVTK